MAKETSVAPQERVNIVYRPALGNAKEEVELPLKLLMLGDYTLRDDERSVEDRKPINIDKDNFNDVMKNQKLKLSVGGQNRISDDAQEGDQLSADLKFDSMKDFEPDSIANQVPELAKLLELRKALNTLKAPLANDRAFKAKIDKLLGDEGSRQKLMDELGLNQ